MRDPSEKEPFGDQFGPLIRVASDPLFPSSPSGLHGAVGERSRPPSRPASTAPEPLDRWFSSLQLDLDDSSWTPIARPASASPVGPIPSPLALPTDDDPVFRNDLAHVLVWFSDDLASQQRLVAAYTLAKTLPRWQIEFLLKLLAQDVDADGHASHLASPIASDSEPNLLSSSGSWRRVADPEPTRSVARTWNPERDSERISPTSSSDTIPVSSHLFHTDLSAWLRLHRLHKYQAVFQRIMDRKKLLAMDEDGLEAIGVAALGARRKFIRLFELIRTEV
ncbi:hypothetical protein PSACC_01051 [Paramicrosporidium saccamoebae]|uniref:SAM domain-containing protein n=1 Tax=Paramicrosporidium saccamoebae TaxID=1246581 RepID=A0A2H9TN17_9FUNG|nr:hypothetical protein PSACC_01051 [Paramicrosporidium saccamoebae]